VNLRVGPNKGHPLAYWTDRYQVRSPDERAKLEAIVREGIHYRPGAEILEKVEAVGRFLIDALERQHGVHTTNFEGMTALQIYEGVRDGKITIECGGIAIIYTLFANFVGIPTRIADSYGVLDGVVISGHVFAESYIPERRHWAFVDLTSRKLYVTRPDGKPMNTVEVLFANRLSSFSDLTARVYREGKLEYHPYAIEHATEDYYFDPNAQYAFGNLGEIFGSPSPFAGFFTRQPVLYYGFHEPMLDMRLLKRVLFVGATLYALLVAGWFLWRVFSALPSRRPASRKDQSTTAWFNTNQG
jgi:hypothetical protein